MKSATTTQSPIEQARKIIAMPPSLPAASNAQGRTRGDARPTPASSPSSVQRHAGARWFDAILDEYQVTDPRMRMLLWRVSREAAKRSQKDELPLNARGCRIKDVVRHFGLSRSVVLRAIDSGAIEAREQDRRGKRAAVWVRVQSVERFIESMPVRKQKRKRDVSSVTAEQENAEVSDGKPKDKL